MAALFVQAAPFLVYNQTRPLIGPKSVLVQDRASQYFTYVPQWKDSYVDATEALKSRGCMDAGLILQGDDWEYPLWALARGVRFQHVAVGNATAGYAREFQPCGIVSSVPGMREVRVGGVDYTAVLSRPVLAVLVPRARGE
jgi:hypothetical protein